MTGLIAGLLASCSATTPPAADTQSAEQAGQPSGPPQQATNAAANETSEPAGVRTSPVVPGRPGRVFIFAGVDNACAPLPAPQITIARPPAKGDISFRQGQETTIAASAAGTCQGAKATGTGVYYTARAGTAGPDNFQLVAKLATGETMTRDFTVSIAQ